MSEPYSDKKVPVQPTVGEMLRSKREALGWSVNAVAQHLKIRAPVLEALERDDYHALPGQAYAIGFLKSYAGLLGLNVEDVIANFAGEHSKRRESGLEKPKLSFPQAVDDHSVPKWLLILLGLGVVGAAYAGWYHFTPHDELIKKAINSSEIKIEDGINNSINRNMPLQTLPSHDAPHDEIKNSELAGKVPEQNFASSETVSSGQQSETQGESQSEAQNNMALKPALAENASSDDLKASSSDTADTEVAKPQQPVSPFVAPLPKVTEEKTTSEENKASATGFDLQFVQDSWAKITDVNGKTLESRVFKAGENWHGEKAASPYKITVGNAGGVVVKAGDVTSAPLGQLGQVKRNIVLSEDMIVKGDFGHNSQKQPDKTSELKEEKKAPSFSKGLDQDSVTH
ncbi:DUF4115 domain-containing protein [Aristophania vespae]|uniref:DUF4115 domain-containing protein n=1 Tax=Aristophania vespae TaxID=2697033 RepID=A0A6P1NJ32_9PROT|nr:helix-turn-helix domain-containing protein [Aristophania vespae]QHI95672.1 DUF4115 domain-containing protein [Aristophania vespae]